MGLKIIATIGVNEGYFHDNKHSINFGTLLQQTCEDYYKENSIAVSFILNKSKAIYLKQHGCPEGGEDTYTLQSVFNPDKFDDLDAWKTAAEEIILKISHRLKQQTVLIEYLNADIKYCIQRTEKYNVAQEE